MDREIMAIDERAEGHFEVYENAVRAPIMDERIVDWNILNERFEDRKRERERAQDRVDWQRYLEMEDARYGRQIRADLERDGFLQVARPRSPTRSTSRSPRRPWW